MTDGGSIVGLDFDNSVMAYPAYDWMGVAKAALAATARYLARDLGAQGIRVNLVAAGPIRTLAAKSIPSFAQFEDVWAQRAPLGWDVKADHASVGKACVALMSDWFPKTTGEVVHVDGGFHAVGACRCTWEFGDGEHLSSTDLRVEGPSRSDLGPSVVEVAAADRGGEGGVVGIAERGEALGVGGSLVDAEGKLALDHLEGVDRDTGVELHATFGGLEDVLLEELADRLDQLGHRRAVVGCGHQSTFAAVNGAPTRRRR